MNSWKEKLFRSLEDNKSLAYSKYVQLATVKPDGRPANRTVVFRYPTSQLMLRNLDCRFEVFGALPEVS
jgi:pyridoxamine 5'-phosphate oxidase